MSSYRLSLVFLMLLWGFGAQAKIVMPEPYKISTRIVNEALVIKIAGHSVQCEEQCGYNLSPLGKFPHRNEFIVHEKKGEKYVQFTISQPSCCVATNIDEAYANEGVAVEDTFLISEIFAEQPELLNEFIAGNMQVRFGASGKFDHYVKITRDDFHAQETRINWRQSKINLSAGTMK